MLLYMQFTILDFLCSNALVCVCVLVIQWRFRRQRLIFSGGHSDSTRVQSSLSRALLHVKRYISRQHVMLSVCIRTCILVHWVVG